MKSKNAEEEQDNVEVEEEDEEKDEAAAPLAVVKRRIVSPMSNNQFTLYRMLVQEYRRMSDGRLSLVFITKLRQCSIVPNLIAGWVAERLPFMFTRNPELMKWLLDPTGEAGLRSPKLELLTGVVNDIPAGEKVVVFSMFYNVLTFAEERLRLEGRNGILLDGSQGVKKRAATIDRFKTDPKSNILLATYQVGGEGLHLIEANHVVFMDMWWNHQVLNQALARCRRKGQAKTVHCYSLVTQKSIESYMGKVRIAKGKHRLHSQRGSLLFALQRDPGHRHPLRTVL